MRKYGRSWDIVIVTDDPIPVLDDLKKLFGFHCRDIDVFVDVELKFLLISNYVKLIDVFLFIYNFSLLS